MEAENESILLEVLKILGNDNFLKIAFLIKRRSPSITDEFRDSEI